LTGCYADWTTMSVSPAQHDHPARTSIRQY
jgi:hypothetical protein